MITFNKYYNHFNFLSGILILCSLILLVFKGLNFGIDFKGGTLIELRSSDDKINVSSLRDKFSQMNLGDVSVKNLVMILITWLNLRIKIIKKMSLKR
jgi:preprotein translocase subunit SecF